MKELYALLKSKDHSESWMGRSRKAHEPPLENVAVLDPVTTLRAPSLVSGQRSTGDVVFSFPPSSEATLASTNTPKERAREPGTLKRKYAKKTKWMYESLFDEARARVRINHNGDEQVNWHEVRDFMIGLDLEGFGAFMKVEKNAKSTNNTIRKRFQRSRCKTIGCSNSAIEREVHCQLHTIVE